MATTTATASKIDTQTLTEIRAKCRADRSVYLRVCGSKVGTCPTTVGFLGKYTNTSGKVTYYACKELYSPYQTWQWHVCFASDLKARITQPTQRIKTYTSLASALAYLNS